MFCVVPRCCRYTRTSLRETQLVNTVETLARTMDLDKKTDLLTLDYSMAFDTVPHQRLLAKLSHYGIKEEGQVHVHNCIKSWLVGRSQTVVLDRESSEPAEAKSGVLTCTVLEYWIYPLQK